MELGLITQNLSYKDIINNINLKLPKTGLVALIGPNGAGKTTLLKTLAGIYKAKGQICFGEHNLNTMSLYQRSQIISYLAQNQTQLLEQNVADIISLGLLNSKLSMQNITNKVHNCAIDLNVLLFLNRRADTLSGGELARVNLARAIIANNPILLADEPIATLDPFYQLEIISYLKKLSEEKLIIVSLHDLYLASSFCSHFILLNGGNLMTSGDKNVLNPNILKSVFNVDFIINELGHILQTAKMA